MSDTPRTDEFYMNRHRCDPPHKESIWFPYYDFARTLERELSAAESALVAERERADIEVANGAHWAAAYSKWALSDVAHKAWLAAIERAELAESRLAKVIEVLRECLLHVGLPTVCGDSHGTSAAHDACTTCGLRARITALLAEPNEGREVAKFWRDDAIRACVDIAKRYNVNAYALTDMETLLSKTPSPPAPQSGDVGVLDAESERRWANHYAGRLGVLEEALRHLVEAYVNKHSPQHRESCLIEAKAALTAPSAGDDARDARRYRWLRKDRGPLNDGLPFIAISHVGGSGVSGWTDEHADKAIDAAIAAGKGE